MKLYADAPGRRARQLVGDLAVATWVVLAVRLGRAVDGRVDATAAEVGRSDGAGRRLAENLGDAGDLLGRAPLVGDEVRSPFDAAAGASRDLAVTGAQAAETIATLGTWLGVLTALVGVLLVAPHYLLRRAGWVLAASTAARLSGSHGSDLLAVRALAAAPLDRLVRQVPDAADGWRRSDPDVVEALADLQLESLGLRAPDRAGRG